MERVGADWKEFGENKGEKTQPDRREGRATVARRQTEIAANGESRLLEILL